MQKMYDESFLAASVVVQHDDVIICGRKVMMKLMIE